MLTSDQEQVLKQASHIIDVELREAFIARVHARLRNIERVHEHDLWYAIDHALLDMRGAA